MKMIEIMTLKGLLFYYYIQVFSVVFFPGLAFHMSHYKEMTYSFLSFLGLKDFLNHTKMNWTIWSWS